MNRGQLFFLVLVNAMVSLVIALAVVWAFEARRPDLEELAAINTPRPTPILAVQQAQPTATVGSVATQEAGDIAVTETPTPDVPVAGAEQVYVVQPGDTMLVIATRYDISVQDILSANNLNDPNFVFAGQKLVIPVQGSSAVTQSTSSGESGIVISDTATSATPQGVRISSITGMGDLPNEQVILVNESDTPYSLQGWQLQRGDGPAYAFRSDVPLYPGGSIRLHTGAGTDTSIDFYWGQSKALWQAGTEAKLVTSDGNLVTSYIVQ